MRSCGAQAAVLVDLSSLDSVVVDLLTRRSLEWQSSVLAAVITGSTVLTQSDRGSRISVSVGVNMGSWSSRGRAGESRRLV